MAYRDTILADSPIEYWEFSETTGTSAASAGSGAHAATHNGGVTVGVTGKIGKSAQYDGVDDVTITPTTVADFMAQTAFTVEMWVKFDSTYTSDYPTFFRRDGASKTFLIRTRNTAVGRAHIIETYFNGRTVDTGSTTFNDGLWHHVVVTKSGTTIRLFVDNVEYTTGNGTATTGGSGATTGNIGRGLGAGEYFKGGIDDVAVYNAALTTTQISNHYNIGSASTYQNVVLTDSPTIYMPFTSNSLTTNLGSRAGVTVTSSGGITWGSGFDGESPIFAGPASATRINYNLNTHDVLNTTAWSVETWFKRNAGQTTHMDIINTYDANNEFGLFIWANDASADDKKIKLFYRGSGGARRTISGPQINDTNWHHVAIVNDATNVTMYLDGVSVGSVASYVSNYVSTTPFRVGAYGDAANNENFYGQIDELAIYRGAALSPTRVSAHYVAGVGGVNAGYTAQPMTASADMPGGMGLGNVQTYSINEDAYVLSSQPNTNYGTLDKTDIGPLASIYTYMKVPAAQGTDIVTNAKVKVVPYSSMGPTPGTTINVSVYSVNAAWSEDTITWNNKPGVTLVKTVPVTFINRVAVEIDITGVDITNGIALTAPSEVLIVSAEHATTSERPSVTYATAPQASVSVTAMPLAATANMPDPVTSATKTVSASGSPMASSAAMPNATVSTETLINISVAAEPMAASAELTNSGFAVPATGSADAMTAFAEAVSPAVSTTVGVTYQAQRMTATAVWVQPMVNGAEIVASEADDKYFQRVMAKNPRIYYRMLGKGSTDVNRGVYNPTLALTYHGVIPRNDGPDGRQSLYFNGNASLEQVEPSGTGQDETTPRNTAGDFVTAFEITMRTTKKNQFLFAGTDLRGGLSTTGGPGSEFTLSDGKISARIFTAPPTGAGASLGTMKGFTDIADGQWHHIVIRLGVNRFNSVGSEVWIDGKLEIRKSTSQFGLWGFPDWIGSRPESVDGWNLGVLPSSMNFVGDMTEAVFYAGDDVLSDDDIPRHYYAVMGYSPIGAEPIEAFAFTPDGAKGRGNQKRALYLYWSTDVDAYGISSGPEAAGAKMPHDPFAGYWWKRDERVIDYNGYKVFTKSVYGKPGYSYRDPVTDKPSLINLETDINIDDYDIIMFGDWPDESSETSVLDRDFPGEKDRLVQQLRWANDRGLGLMVTHPRLAVDLGIVDRVDFAPTLRETSPTGDLYDYGSAYKFPWNIDVSAGLEGAVSLGGKGTGVPADRRPEYLRFKANFYGDSNKNDRFRVRALIPGLTDIPSYMIKDAVYYEEPSEWGWNGTALKYLHRMNGLQIGDEFLFNGTDMGLDGSGLSNATIYRRVGRRYGAKGVPAGHVKAGTVVATFGATHWLGDREVENPYKDWATTIVLQPGDSLNGRPVGGKIFVNFTESHNGLIGGAVGVQVLPGSPDDDGNTIWPNTYPVETAEQREWEYSFTRESLRAVGGQGTSTTVNYVNPETGEVLTATVAGRGSGFYMTNVSQLFPVVAYPLAHMIFRGYQWLADRTVQQPGANTQRVEAMKAQAEMPAPNVVAQRDNTVAAQPMNALAQMTRVAESTVGDAEIRMLPMTAIAEFTGFSRVISAAPMTANATFVDSFDMVYTSGEQVVLTLHNANLVTLYLKEEA